MIPAETLVELATLGLQKEQVERVAAMLKSVELATQEECGAAIEARRASEAARTARYRERGGGNIPYELRNAVFERDGYTCVYCGSQENLQCDHVTPVSKGGETNFDNLATACRVCNAKKKDRDRKAFVRGLSKDKTGQSGNPRTSSDTPPSREEYNTTRAHAVIPVGISNDIPPIDKNPNTSCLVKKPSRKTQLAEDAQPSDEDRATADEHGLSAQEFREEWRAFREHHCSHGNLMKNWHLAWCTWLRRRKKFQPRAGPSGERDYGKGALAELIRNVDERLQNERGGRIEGEISGGNVFSLPVVQSFEGRSRDDDGDVSPFAQWLRPGSG